MALLVSSTTELVLKTADVALDDLFDLNLSWREPGDQIAALDAAVKFRAKIDSFIADVASEADRTGTAKDAGYNSCDQMMADRTGADAVQIRSDIRLGRWLSGFGEFDDAFKAGAILRTHLELIRKSVDSARTEAALQVDQHEFVAWAREFDFVDFERLCIHWVNTLDTDGAEPKEQIKNTRFKATKHADGTVKLDGFLDPVTGHAFMTAWNHENQKLFRASQDSDEPAPSTGKRGSNALMNLIVRGFARKDGSFPIPLINVVASETVIEDTIERVNNPSAEPLPVSFTDIDKRCEFIDGTPLHPTYLLALLGIATFRRQILDAKGRTIDVSVNARCFTPWQQQALRVEARGRCTNKGCDAPFPWLEADHIHPHSKGGPTAMGNGIMRCSPDNKAKGNKTGH